MSSTVLSVHNLTKRFGTSTAVCGISFHIQKGEIFGLLGPNGAGKSTTIEMILGLISPTEGKISVFGKDIAKNREEILSRINYSSTYIQFMARLTVRENLVFFGKLYNVRKLDKKIASVAKQLEIEELLPLLFYKLSSGQKTRVILAKTLLNDPEFLLLDEPTASLDPDIAFKVRELLQSIHRERGVSMLYTSHNMAEVEEMCDRVIFLQKGKIVAEGAPDELKRAARDYYIEVAFASAKEQAFVEFINARGWKFEIESAGHLNIKTSADDLGETMRLISRENFGIYDLDINKPDLEEVFLKLAKG
ncbi:MAG: ABC transporter ATP-binding protein [Candidatus Jacksonbacteria bacterium]|nr:ABC transporter ATP-binding protein [Candidatus Jacksonbacteria bacterium]